MKFRNFKRIVTFNAVVFAAAAALAQTNYNLISNVNQSTADHNGVWNTASLAASFTTGNTTTFLSGVSVSMFQANGTGGHFALAVYSDAGGSPGSNLATLSGINPTNSGIYNYTNTSASALTLSTNTAYWIVASSPDATGPTAFEWNYRFDAATDSGSIWTMGASKFSSGGGWSVSGTYQQFSVTVTNPIPPAISISQPIVLTFPSAGIPFVLQQNSDLATTNWVPVTNAILSGVISNQTVFIVPPNRQQMYYRLRAP